MGVISLSAAAQFPSEPAQKRLAETLQDSEQWRDNYPVIRILGLNVETVDAWSECVTLGHTLSSSPLPFASRPISETSRSSDCGEFVQALISPTTELNYSRFYHGASAILRIALTAFSLEFLRLLVTVVILLLASSISFLAYRSSKIIGLGFIVYFTLFTTTLLQGLSLPHGISTVVGLGGICMTTIIAQRSSKYTLASAAASGVTYALIAQLFVPMQFAVLTGVMIMAGAISNTEFKEAKLFLGAQAAIAWIAGYGITMTFRFIWSYFVLGSSVALSEGNIATSARITSDPYQLLAVTPKMIYRQTAEYPLRLIGVILLVLMIGWAAGAAKYWYLTRRQTLTVLTPFLCAAIWLTAFGGHNGHGWVIYVVNAMVMNLLLLFTINLKRSKSLESTRNT